VGAIVSVRMYPHTIVYFYMRIPKNLVNCHDIEKIVSVTWTHLAKIGATGCVVGDMSRHVGNISSCEAQDVTAKLVRVDILCMVPKNIFFCIKPA